jgi:adenylate cyclase
MSQTRRLAAILAADVAGYSRLIGADEAGTLQAFKTIRAKVLESKIAEHNGRLVKTTGDGFLVEFSSVVDALRCATEVQTHMAERNVTVPTDRRIEFRIGINVGDVVVEDGDIFGDGVNIAARLEGLAEPGGICVSALVQRDAAGKLDLAFEDLGEQQLKNIAQPVRVYRVVTERHAEAAMGLASLPLPDKPSIAVLAFQNMSGDAEQEYFSDGISEDITTALSKVRWFFVIARNSSFTYKGQAVDVKQVGRELGVRYVLEGSVRNAGNRIRVTAQLVDAASGNHIWAERYDRELAAIFAVQDEITDRVVATIEPELYAAEHFRSQRKPPESLDAWECVVRALSSVGQDTLTGVAAAEALCRRAIAIAPSYGQAHSLLAWVLVRGTSRSGGRVRTVLPEAMAEARTALGLDERDPWAHATHGVVLWRMRRHDEAVRAFRRALELNPNFAVAHAQLGLTLAIQGAHEDAAESAEHALRLSPRDLLVGVYASVAMAAARFAARRYVDAVAWARNAIERSPEHLPAEGLATLLRLQPQFSLAWMSENMAYSDDVGERLLEGLCKAGMPQG